MQIARFGGGAKCCSFSTLTVRDGARVNDVGRADGGL